MEVVAATTVVPSPSYACALSTSDIDLSLRSDLASSVQDYLMRIVDELQQLGGWAAACADRVTLCEQRLTQRDQHEQREREQLRVPTHQAALLAQTETELLRREIQRASLEVFQRATTQLAYVQNSFRSEYDDQLADAQRRADDKLCFFTQQTVAAVDTLRADAGARAAAADKTLATLLQRVDDADARLEALERAVGESLAALTATQGQFHHELSVSQRRLDSVEASAALQVAELKGATHEAAQSLRASQTQLSSKLQVTRLEMQQQSEELHRKVLQLHRFLLRLSASGGGAFAHAGGGGDRPASGGGGSSTAVRVGVGAAALIGSSAAHDCFLYAKATLPPREGDARDAVAKRPPPQATATQAATLVGGGGVSFGGAKKAASVLGLPRRIDDALTIQSSPLSQPLGREADATCVGGAASSPSSSLPSSPRRTSLRSPVAAAVAPAALPTRTLRPHAPRPASSQNNTARR